MSWRHERCSTRPEPLAWSESAVLGGDLRDAVTALRARHDEVHVIGSLDLLQSLLRAEIVDQMNLWIYPLLLGSGKRAFGPGIAPTALTLATSVTYPNGTVNLVFANSGRPTFGDMAAEQADLLGLTALDQSAGRGASTTAET